MKTFSDEPLSQEERELAQLTSRLGPHGEPSPALDARILAAARAAALRGPVLGSVRTRRPRWPVAMGVAASALLAIGLAWQLRPVQQPTIVSEAPAAFPAPAMPSSDASIAGSSGASRSTASEPAADKSTATAPAETDEKQATQAAVVESRAPAAVSVPAPPPPPAAPMSTQAYEPPIGISDRDSTAAKATQSLGNAANSGTVARRSLAKPGGNPSQAASGALRTEPAPVLNESRASDYGPSGFASPPPAAPSEPAAQVINAPAPADVAASPSAELDSITVTGSRIQNARDKSRAARADRKAASDREKESQSPDKYEAGSRATRTDLQVPVSDDAGLAVNEWLERVRTRYGLGDAGAARQSLLLFVREHPSESVPADLEPLLER